MNESAEPQSVNCKGSKSWLDESCSLALRSDNEGYGAIESVAKTMRMMQKRLLHECFWMSLLHMKWNTFLPGITLQLVGFNEWLRLAVAFIAVQLTIEARTEKLPGQGAK